MDGHKYVKPKYEDLIVRDPLQLTPLPKDGAWVPWVGREGKYWRRRYTEGSIIFCNPPTPKKKYNKTEIKQNKPKGEVKK